LTYCTKLPRQKNKINKSQVLEKLEVVNHKDFLHRPQFDFYIGKKMTGKQNCL
jgi:hypothetical protein